MFVIRNCVSMPRQPFAYPDWALKHRTPGTELRHIGGKFYLYEYKTVYDASRKKPKKVSGKLLGRITEEQGLVAGGKRQLEKAVSGVRQISVGPDREFGVSHYISTYFGPQLERLVELFGQEGRLIFLLAYCRLCYQSPLKRMPHHIMHAWLSEELKVSAVNDKQIRALLNHVGKSRQTVVDYMRGFISEDDFVLADTTHILSKSQHIELSHRGYNSQMNFEPQINLMYLYGSKSRMPVFYRLHAGNIREVKALKNTIVESGIQNATLIGDKGFFSKANLELLEQQQLRYILPLKRDNVRIDYSAVRDASFKANGQYFKHEGRIIWYISLSHDGKQSLWLFIDDFLRQKEEKDYLFRIESHPDEYSLDNFQKSYFRFGTFALISNLDAKTPQEIFTLYKSRMNIEQMFDSLKNLLDADSTYMQNEDTLQGWMFINHIALQWYQHLYITIAEKELTAKYSVKDLLEHLREIRKVLINNQWLDAETTKATQTLLKKLDVIRKIMPS